MNPPKQIVQSGVSHLYIRDKATKEWMPLGVPFKNTTILTEVSDSPEYYSVDNSMARFGRLLAQWYGTYSTPPKRVKRKKKYKLRLISKWIKRNDKQKA